MTTALQAAIQLADVKIRAERKAGQLLGETIEHKGGRKPLHDASVSLVDFGIESTQSHRWQLEASVPELSCRRDSCHQKAPEPILSAAYGLPHA